jgi:adenylate cyclase
MRTLVFIPATAMKTALHPRPAADRVSLPVLSQGRLLGLLFLDGLNGHDQVPANDAVLRAVASHLEAALDLVQPAARPAMPAPEEEPLAVSFCPKDSAIYIEGRYLIRGVAGALLRRLLKEYVARGRTEFSTRELRHDPSLKLPDLFDNLGARLVLLQRRLEQQCPALRIERTGRGRFRLVVKRLVQLAEH